MAGEGLKVVVGADVKPAEQALKSFVDTAKNAGQAAGEGLSSGLNKAIPAIKSIPKEAKTAASSISFLGKTLEDLRAKEGATKDFLKVAKTNNEVIVLNDRLRSIQSEIKRVENLGNPTFNSLASNI